MQIDSTQ